MYGFFPFHIFVIPIDRLKMVKVCCSKQIDVAFLPKLHQKGHTSRQHESLVSEDKVHILILTLGTQGSSPKGNELIVLAFSLDNLEDVYQYRSTAYKIWSLKSHLANLVGPNKLPVLSSHCYTENTCGLKVHEPGAQNWAIGTKKGALNWTYYFDKLCTWELNGQNA